MNSAWRMKWSDGFKYCIYDDISGLNDPVQILINSSWRWYGNWNSFISIERLPENMP